MVCPQCKLENPPGSERCSQCNTLLGAEGATISGHGMTSQPSGGLRQVVTAAGTLQPGLTLSNRYEILDVLGEGGMGAVYKARDLELDRLVALKVIRPELAGNPEILQRFKNELILARKITHKNVNRIFDLGESDGTKFISMEFVDGEDLKSIIRQRHKLPPEEAIPLIIQICRALNAAHSEGVVHRDLKPHNVMVDQQGTVQVMDFGLAASTEMTGFTQTGALLGTPEYMSPEQAKGEKADARSDIFALGIIFYEMLTGGTPYSAESAYSTLLKRTQERAVPVSKLDPSIPQHVSEVVSKCLQIDPRHRYQSAIEIIKDLEGQRRPRSPSLIARLPPRLQTITVSRVWLVAAAVVAALAIVASVLLLPALFKSPPAEPTKALSLAILPFHNASGDPSLDWLGAGLADMLTTDVGQSDRLRTVSTDRLHQVLQDLRVSASSTLDSSTLSRVAEFISADVLIWGKYFKLGDQIRIDATLFDLKRQQTVSLKAQAPSEEKLLWAVEQLAESIHMNLSLPTREVEELQANAFQPSTESMEALRYYNEGLAFMRQGNYLEAVRKLEASTKVDPEFALAHAGLGQAYATLGYGGEAEEYSRQALELSQDLPPQERYLIEAQHARIINDLDKAIDSYKRLVERMPANTQLHFELGELYRAKGSFDLAQAQYQRALKEDPYYLDALYAAGQVENKRQDFEKSLDYLNRALNLSIRLDNQEAKAKILNAIGFAYQWLNKRDEALRYYQESLAIKREIGDKRGVATSLNQIAQIHDLEGKPEEARASYEEALRIYREIGDKKGVGAILMNLGNLLQDRGEYEEALKSAKESLQVQIEVGDEYAQAVCQSNIGAIYFVKGQYRDALTYYERALQLREKLNVPIEIAETLYNLAEASARIGQYDQALTYYLRALEIWRRSGDRLGVGYASYGMGLLFQNQGRYGAALDAMTEAFQIFSELQERSLWLGEIQAAYGHSLGLVGRSKEAQENLAQALALARELKSDPLVSRILNFQGDLSFYRGDFDSAREAYRKALRAVTDTTDRYLILLSNVNLAKVEVKQGSARTAIRALEKWSQEAEALGLKHLFTECSLYRAEALVTTKQYAMARKELQATLRTSENSGLKALAARSHYLLAKVLQATGNQAQASRHYGLASTLLEEMRAEAGSSPLLERGDLQAIYAESSRLSRKPG